MTPTPLRPVPARSVRPWAGSRLGPVDEHVGELWLAGPDARVALPDGEITLDELAARTGASLVGSAGMDLYGPRFPLLVKLIDAADWLSLQVHPDDALARDLYGPDAVGKAEAWVVIEAHDGAELVTGPAEDLPAADVLAAVAAGAAGRRHCHRTPATRGDTLLLRPGTLHAIGPGTLVYELEQPSDLTFRISDWGRSGRQLHIAESLRALRPELQAERAGTGFRLDGGLLRAGSFNLELVGGRGVRTPAGRSPEVVTALVGGATLQGRDWIERIDEWQTVVVPAGVDGYAIAPDAGATVAVGSLP